LGFRKVEKEKAGLIAFYTWGGKDEDIEKKHKEPSKQAIATAFFM
jgi:hypothetical protein